MKKTKRYCPHCHVKLAPRSGRCACDPAPPTWAEIYELRDRVTELEHLARWRGDFLEVEQALVRYARVFLNPKRGRRGLDSASLRAVGVYFLRLAAAAASEVNNARWCLKCRRVTCLARPSDCVHCGRPFPVWKPI